MAGEALEFKFVRGNYYNHPGPARYSSKHDPFPEMEEEMARLSMEGFDFVSMATINNSDENGTDYIVMVLMSRSLR